MIHSLAVVDRDATVADDVTIGPFSIIGPEVVIGAGSEIGAHVVIKGPTRIGKGNRIFQFCSIGEDAQDKKFGGEQALLEIGDDNTVREFCSINRGTAHGGGVTRIGNNNWLMAYVHIAHDCFIGDHTVFANGASLAGHVRVEDYVTFGGFTLVHQFCAIGTRAFSAFSTGISQDVPPFVMVSGSPAKPHGINVEGLKRHGFAGSEIAALRQAYKTVYRTGLRLQEAIAHLEPLTRDCAHVTTLREFLRATTRGIVR